MPATSLLGSIGLGSSGWRREKASRRCGQRGRPLGARAGHVAKPLQPLRSGRPATRWQLAAHAVEAADDHGQQVVEVVGDAAGELADRLHLLRLPQLLLRLQPLRDLGSDPFLQLVIELGDQRGRFAGGVTRLQQLLFVTAAVAAVEHGDQHGRRSIVLAGAESGIQDRRQPIPVLADDVERDLPHFALHRQQRREVGLEIDLGRRSRARSGSGARENASRRDSRSIRGSAG